MSSSKAQSLLNQLTETQDAALLDKTLAESLQNRLPATGRFLPLLFENESLYLATPDYASVNSSELAAILQCKVTCLPISEMDFDALVLAKPTPTLETSILAPVNLQPDNMSELFKAILVKAKTCRASDIHVEPGAAQAINVRFRIDGVLHDIETLQLDHADIRRRFVSCIKVSAGLDIAETRIPQDGRITEVLNGEGVDLRISTLPSLHGENVVIRLLPHKSSFITLQDLGMEGASLTTYEQWLEKPQGLVLLTGQTGSGKTSTLYTSLSLIHDRSKNIITIEDPIEYQLPGVTQVQVQPKVGMTFANGLRAILRQDPDIILVGEVRDYDTTEIVYQAALTGHLVLSTLHTNDAPSAIIRLMDINVEPYLIASATLGVVAQRLVRRLCLNCSRPFTPEADRLMEAGITPHPDSQFREAIGCEQCFHTGYYGREGIFEVMDFDDHLREMVSNKASLSSIKAYLKSQRVLTLFDAAVSKVHKGITTIDEVFRVVPPSNKPQAERGSVLVLMLFLLAVISIIWIENMGMIEGGSAVFKAERQYHTAFYAAESGINAMNAMLKQRFPTGYLQSVAKNQVALSELKPPPLAGLLATVTVDQADVQLETQTLPATATLLSPTVAVMPVNTTITATPKLNRFPDRTVAPPQQVESQTVFQAGMLPFSWFTAFNLKQGIPVDVDKRAYSPLRRSKDIASDWKPTLPKSVWPVFAEAPPAKAGNTATGLSLQAVTGEHVAIDAKLPQPVMLPLFALDVAGDVDSLSLACQGEAQVLQFRQLIQGGAKPQWTDNRIIIDTAMTSIQQQTFSATRQQNELTDIKTVANQTRLLQGPFAGLFRVMGSIRQLSGGEVCQPMTLAVNNTVSLNGSISYSSASKTQAVLGLIALAGLNTTSQPLLKTGNPPKTSLTQFTIEGAVLSNQVTVSPKQTLRIVGSLAILNGAWPESIRVEPDDRLASLQTQPPYFPALNPDEWALIVQQPPKVIAWQERR